MAEDVYKSDLEESFNKKLQFLIILDKMKSIYRQTLLADKSRRETDAEHSWHMALMAMLFSEFAPVGVNAERAVKMCLVHDLVEIYAGDTFCYDTVAIKDKKERERSAAKKLFSILPKKEGQEIMQLWQEFEEAKTPDALFCVSIDRFQPVINNFLTDGHTWRKGNVQRSMVENRVSVIKEGLPIAWNTICDILNDSEEKGYFAQKCD